MTFAFEEHSRLPALAWCARIRAGQPIRVRHGSDVETRDEGFVEGAWDGDFDRFEFDRALMLCGSGGRLREGRARFAAPCHPLERLFAIRNGADLLVSNSLVFVLREAGDGLDPAHPDYFFDFVRQVRRGITPPPTRLPTRSGGQVELFPFCNLDVGPELTLTRQPKPLGLPPSTYDDYFRLLVTTTTRLAENAGTSGRKRTHRMVAACSRGYDSTAAAAIASLAGCREGVTFAKSTARSGHPLTRLYEQQTDDSGADSLRSLGLTVAEFDRTDVTRLPGLSRAEFFVSSPAAITDATSAIMESTLRGSVFVSGRHGERYWGPTKRCSRTDLREVDDCLLSGHALGEFRLRTSFVHLPLPYIGALHGPSIYRITSSREMDRWRLGTGYYDRPIARRIAEEAGVPRENFGHHKMGAGGVADRSLDPDSQRDFESFVLSEVPHAIQRRLDRRPYAERLARHRRLAYFRTHWAHLPLTGWLLTVSGMERLHLMWNSVNQYQFHWGADRIKDRYVVS